MTQKNNYIQILLASQNTTAKNISHILGIDYQKFNRWSKPEHPNNKVLIAAVKFVLRFVCTDNKRKVYNKTEWNKAAEELKERMDNIGL